MGRVGQRPAGQRKIRTSHGFRGFSRINLNQGLSAAIRKDPRQRLSIAIALSLDSLQPVRAGPAVARPARDSPAWARRALTRGPWLEPLLCRDSRTVCSADLFLAGASIRD